MSSNTSNTVTGDLSRETAQKAVIQARDLQVRQASIKNAGPQFVNSLENSQLFRLNWDRLLSAAPTSLGLLGTCVLAANSETARTIQVASLDQPLKGFSSCSLNGCLIEIVNQGHKAFRSADTNMDLIAQVSFEIAGPKVGSGGMIRSILNCLSGSSQDIQDGLADQMKRIKRATDRCCRAAKTIDDEFEHWLNLVAELHRATIDRHGKAEQQARQAKLELKIAEAKATSTTEQQKKQIEAVAELKSTLKTARETFQKASDSYPSGWSVIGMEFVGGLTRTFLGAANSVVALSTASVQARVSPNGQMVTTTKPIEPVDVAYTQIQTYITPITSTKAIVITGKSGSPDWDEIVNPKDDSNALLFLESMHQMATKAFGGGSTSLPGQTYRHVLSEWATILAELKTLTSGATSSNWKSPDPESPQVVGLISKTVSMYQQALTLDTTAKTQSGVPVGQIPAVAAHLDASGGSSTSSSTAEAILTSATNRLNQTQAAFSAANENYQKATDTLALVQGELITLQGRLLNLQADKLTYDEIKDILASSIAMVIDLKDEIDNLLRFFDAVAQLVQVCTDFQVQEFLDFLANQVDRLDGGAIAGFTFGDFRRQEVFTMVIMIRAYYVVFNRIANMYTNTSKDNIMPGIKMVNRLSAPGLTSVQMAEKHTELRDYTKKSMQDITAMVASVQEDLRAQLHKMVDQASQDVGLLPPAPDSAKMAIEQGKKENTDAVEKDLKAFETATGKMNLEF